VDVLPIVDVSDTTMAASGTTKKITSNQILGAGGTATLASATITGDLTVDTNVLKVDTTNNRVGIGTASPGFPLDIIGASGVGLRIYESSTGNNNRLQITQEGTETRFNSTFSTGSAFYTWQIASSEQMRLNSSGLGVGVTPSTAWNTGGNLQVGVFAGLYTNSSLGAVDLTSNSIRTGSDTYQYLSSSSNNASRFQQRDGSFRWFNAPAGTSPNAITFTQAMTLDASGNLGVGITNPSFRLHALVSSGADRDIFAAQVLAASNGLQVKWNHATTTLRIILANIPTSSAGLATGTLWNDAGTIKIA
jgi:hypothetical protein